MYPAKRPHLERKTMLLFPESLGGGGLGPELLSTAGTGVMDASNWNTVGLASLTNPSAGILRTERTTNPNPGASQSVLTIGKTYRVTDEGRSDGNATLRMSDSVTVQWTGTNSTSWQEIDVEFVATGTLFIIQAVTNTGTQYAEWQNMSVKEVL